MTKKHILIIFLTAGLVLGLAAGIFFYRSAKVPSADEAAALLQTFVEQIAAGNLKTARGLMTEETASMLRDPGTALGEAVYHSLMLKTVDNVRYGADQSLNLEVILTTLDTLKISGKADLLFDERSADSAVDPDELIADIYDEILSRDDLPLIDSFCIIRMSYAGGTLRIVGDESLQQCLENTVSASTQISGEK